MGRKRKLNIGRRIPEDSNQHIQASNNEGTQSIPTDTIPTHAQGSNSDEGQKQSKTNKRNRAKYEDVHCMGTKSLPKLIDERKKKAKGVSPECKEIYIDTHTRKDGSIVNEKAAEMIEKLDKYNNEAGTSQSSQTSQNHMHWKDDIFSKVQGPDKRERVRCMGRIPKPKKSKVVLSENQELRNRVSQMESLLGNVMTLIQNRFSGEDVDDILQVARQVIDASSAPEQTNSPSPDTNEDNGANKN